MSLRSGACVDPYGINVYADQFQSLDVSAREPNRILHELRPFGHDASRPSCAVRERTVGVDERCNQYSLNLEFCRKAARQKTAALDFGCCRFELP